MDYKDFYLGRLVDSQTGETGSDPLLYDPDDLTTHAVIVGMTGSGKTGLCLDLMEEAALHKVPALMLDPKGDITNALLHFPDLAPADFEPWINADDVKRAGKTVAEAAASTATLWRNGLADWDIGPERIQQLKDAVQFSIYTPGSDIGLPISILASLAAPDIPWSGNEEILRERIGGTVTAILGLAGMSDIDPVQSREHILLANIFENAWSSGNDLTLEELIMQTQNPPFEKLGVFDIKMFFPDKDRFGLAMKLNNILASPSFQSWLEGEPLDIATMLFMPDGTPRHTIFYLAHLNDDERMFFTTLLYSAVETWMRTQKGTGSLRALVYFDEIFGYLPPVGNPPSKEPMLRLLKQARAFGVGMVLATQNPVDVDYKALSNAGTWFIGKLGTDQDKERLLDGLESASGAGLDRREYDRLISGIGKRVFLLRNVHEKAPVLFQTRWAMNYLAGPMTRTQIPALNALAGAAPSPTTHHPTSTTQLPSPITHHPTPIVGTATKPAVPGRVSEYFLPNNLTFSEAIKEARQTLSNEGKEAGMIYRPVLLAQAEVRFNDRKYDLQKTVNSTAIVEEPDRRGMIRWEDYVNTGGQEPLLDQRDFDHRPLSEATFGELEAPFNDGRLISTMQKDLAEWLYRESTVTVRVNEALDQAAGPDVDYETFLKGCLEAAEDEIKEDVAKVETKFERKIAAVEKKLTKEERELEDDLAELKSRRLEEGAKAAETVFGWIMGRKRSASASLTKRRMTAKAKADVEESEDEIERLKAELVELKEEQDEAIEEIAAKWQDIADDITEEKLTPFKKNISVLQFGIAWLPHFIVDDGGRSIELPGFKL
ncbi:MAG: type IV secretion system DNA-binding domain-containing protein [Ardenticatenaceae bacterium]|nr:type IV secretion system DNA-binding domain-containing protein [Ardenticatenaceae bacterium]